MRTSIRHGIAFVIVAVVAMCPTVGQAQLTITGLEFNADATLDTDFDDRWEDTTAISGLDFELDSSATAVIRMTGLTGTAGITAAYDFPGMSTGNFAGALLSDADTATRRSFHNAPGDWSTQDVTIEIWFKPDNLTPTPANGQILFEDGGGTGFGFFVHNNEVQLRKENGGGIVTSNISTIAGDFIQAVGTYDVSAGKMELFVNGASAGTATPGGGDWSGGDAAAVGTRGAANTGGIGNGQASTESFDGQIAIFRVYRSQLLDVNDVGKNFAAVTATDVFFENNNGAWDTATNWDTNIEPTSAQNAFINGGNTATITASGEVAGSLTVGSNNPGGDGAGSGTLIVTSGSLDVSGRLNIAGETTSDTAGGAVTIGAAGQVTVSGGNTEVGRGGTGSLTVNGGTFSQMTNNLVLAQAANSQGTVTLNSGTLNVGDGVGSNSDLNFNSGTSLFDHKGGDVFVERNINMTNNAAADATYNLDAGMVNVTNNLNMNAGTSELTITGGAVTVGADLNQASGSGSSVINLNGGSLNVNGPNGIVDRSGTSTINLGETAAANSTSGTDISVDFLNINPLNTGPTVVTYTRSGGTLNVKQDLTLGGPANAGDNDKGNLTQNGGTISVGNDMVFGGAPNTEGGTYILNGGSLTVTGSVVETATSVDSAQFYVDADTINGPASISIGGDITVQSFRTGNAGGSVGKFELNDATKTLTNTGTFVVGEAGNGQFNLVNGSVVVTNGLDIAGGNNGVGLMNVSGGNLTVNGGNVDVGENGIGTLSVTGGTVDINTLLRLGVNNDAQANGTVTINLTNASDSFDVSGATHVGVERVGELNVLGSPGAAGVVSFGEMILGVNNNANSDGTVNINLANSTDVVTQNGNLLIGNGGKGTFNLIEGTFDHTGGEIKVGADSNSAGARKGTFVLGNGTSNPTLNATGGDTEVGADNGDGEFTMNSGTFNQNGAVLVIGQEAGSMGTFTLNDGTVDVENQIRFNRGTSLFEQNGGVVNVGTTLDLVNAAASPATPTAATYRLNDGELNVGDRAISNLLIGNFNTADATALVDIRNGNVNISNSIRLAQVGANSSGTLRVGTNDGSGGNPTIELNHSFAGSGGAGAGNGNFEVANAGTGTFEFLSGTINQNSGNFITGQSVGSIANATIGGGDGPAVLNILGTGGLGDWNTNVGHGIVNIVSGGTVNVNKDINLGNNSNANSGLALTIDGGTVNVGVAGAGNIEYRNLGPQDQIDLKDGTLNLTASNGGGNVVFTGATALQFSFTGGTLIDVDTFGESLTQTSLDSASRFVIGIEGDTARPADGSTTTITGDYSLVSGSLVVDIFGPNSHGFNGETGGSFMIDPLDPTLDSDILEVTGSANLDGLLEVALNGFEPYPFAWYDVVVARDITLGDNFAVDGVGFFRVINDPTDPLRQILQVAVPEPGSIAIWCLLGLVALVGSRNWLRRRAI